MGLLKKIAIFLPLWLVLAGVFAVFIAFTWSNWPQYYQLSQAPVATKATIVGIDNTTPKKLEIYSYTVGNQLYRRTWRVCGGAVGDVITIYYDARNPALSFPTHPDELLKKEYKGLLISGFWFSTFISIILTGLIGEWLSKGKTSTFC
ncbi:hypothetical protein GeomeDRAFT_2937 [Geobacter metallireducens RCH3]|uniref:DUF3592 domain-containing protein n=1 Tax=Geobacter metallireducens (strain ATCC 53774 / DSM 7210 / GS-15) TaxID=269799 RepID=Q39RA4_GEOMG|nr:hypothetical protein [Geobacter metallireducens]ABB33220.1 hypothetical protein Gmet_3005 [Geobacter metallireducens GS-15]EHP84653.1 hypothetical protein GeomeDRAFT_2937 [Geobacter metallireducens RCH3]